MRIFAGILGLVLLLTTLWDAFETIILPRRVTRNVPSRPPVLSCLLGDLVRNTRLDSLEKTARYAPQLFRTAFPLDGFSPRGRLPWFWRSPCCTGLPVRPSM